MWRRTRGPASHLVSDPPLLLTYLIVRSIISHTCVPPTLLPQAPREQRRILHLAKVRRALLPRPLIVPHLSPSIIRRPPAPREHEAVDARRAPHGLRRIRKDVLAGPSLVRLGVDRDGLRRLGQEHNAGERYVEEPVLCDLAAGDEEDADGGVFAEARGEDACCRSTWGCQCGSIRAVGETDRRR